MTSSLTQKAKAVTHQVRRLVSQSDTKVTHATILTDSMNLLHRAESGDDTKITHATILTDSMNLLHRVESGDDTKVTHATILTDSMNLLHRVESGVACPDWYAAVHNPRPRQATVWGNQRAERLANTTHITAGLQLGRAQLLKGLRN